MTAKHAIAASEPGLPLVVQVGFAGSRRLFDLEAHPEVDAADFEAALQAGLRDRLSRLALELGLGDKHFLCGISQVAIGADTLFTRTCAELGILQRIFLPQPREDYLLAEGSDGPDFSEEQRETARGMLSSPHIIQERVVSDSPDRQKRFEDTNREIVRVSDVLVCLICADGSGKAGGTLELLRYAQKRRPVLEIRVTVGPDGKPAIDEQWHRRQEFKSPHLPQELANLNTDLTGVPETAAFCQVLKTFASQQARWQQRLFRIAALIIISTHVGASVLAVLAMKPHEPSASHGSMSAILLITELALLVIGWLGVHEFLHFSGATVVWGMARLVAEIGRSVIALTGVPGYLAHLFTLPIPASLRPLLRTLNVMHLRATRFLHEDDWTQRRDAYVAQRLAKPGLGQIEYYRNAWVRANSQLRSARWFFRAASVCAIGFTSLKLVAAEEYLPPLNEEFGRGEWQWFFGAMAILLPVFAVAALSLAAAFDLEARTHTYADTLEFLEGQKNRLENAESEREFADLAMEAETYLLGETVTWYSRRAFTGVA
jgi:hypothetical protein